MNNEGKKEYLNRYQQARARFDDISEEMLRIRSEACKISPAVRDIPSGGNFFNDRIGRAVERLEACAEEMEKEATAMERCMLEVKAVIASVSDEVLRRILELRYINGSTWEQIAEKMNYTWRHILRLHGEALKRVIVCHTGVL